MSRHANTLAVGLVLVAACTLFGVGALAAQAQDSSCHRIESQSEVPAGFGSPVDVFSRAGDLLIQARCEEGALLLAVGSGSARQFIFERGYAWHAGSWQPFAFEGEESRGQWLVGVARARIARTSQELAQNNFAVAYVCTWVPGGAQSGGAGLGAWKCGCRDQACGENLWQLQVARTGGEEPPRQEADGGREETSVVLHPMEGDLEELVRDLKTPWGIAFLPEGELLLTERPGVVVHIARDGEKTFTIIEGVHAENDTGLLGIELHPDFAENSFVYLYVRKGNEHRVERYRYANQRVVFDRVILNGIPAGFAHGGGRLRFGPDGLLYVSVGDAEQRKLPQNKNSLAGKILRITDEGEIPPDNPFGSAVYSYGHRNPQGLAFDHVGHLWAAEHGEEGCDEVNLIQKGTNYGWPVIDCARKQEDMVVAWHHTGGATWAPSGIAYHEGSLYVGGLRGQALYEIEVSGTQKGAITAHYKQEFGRIRSVRVGPDNMLYLTTSRHDYERSRGRGNDTLIRVDPTSLQ